MREGLMMDDYPLSLTAVVQRAERFTPSKGVVSRRPDGTIHRTTVGACAGIHPASTGDRDAGATATDAVTMSLDVRPEAAVADVAGHDTPTFDFEVGPRMDAPPIDAPCNHELHPTIRDFRGYSAASGPRVFSTAG